MTQKEPKKAVCKAVLDFGVSDCCSAAQYPEQMSYLNKWKCKQYKIWIEGTLKVHCIMLQENIGNRTVIIGN
jgi:hypothetical protein